MDGRRTLSDLFEYRRLLMLVNRLKRERIGRLARGTNRLGESVANRLSGMSDDEETFNEMFRAPSCPAAAAVDEKEIADRKLFEMLRLVLCVLTSFKPEDVWILLPPGARSLPTRLLQDVLLEEIVEILLFVNVSKAKSTMEKKDPPKAKSTEGK